MGKEDVGGGTYSIHSKLVTAARFSSCLVILLPAEVSILVASCLRARPIPFSFADVWPSSEISGCFFPFTGADVGPALGSIFTPAGVAPERPGVASLLSEDWLRSMLTDLRSRLGVAYCVWLFWALDLLDGAGEATCCTGVMGRSSVELALGRFAGGTANDASSSVRGRFSVTLVLVGAGLVDALGVDAGTGVVASPRRAATLGIGFFLMTGGPVTFGWVSAAFDASLRSFFSAFPLLAGKRRIWPTTGAFVFENFSFTTMLGSVGFA
jgi:hypothetical protein